MRARTKIAVLYTLFAAVSTVANLGTQALVTKLYEGNFSIAISIVLGTAVGLPVKYVLDKLFIFKFRADNIAHDSKLFVLYSLLAIVTTAIFWGTEVLFQVWFGTEFLRLVGGALGLIIGYTVKYQLDKKYVFRTSEGK